MGDFVDKGIAKAAIAVRFKITVAYDGSQFFGWQRQPNVPSVQAAIEDALEKLYGVPIGITASGRTDEGVHAMGQVAHFDIKTRISASKLIPALNFHLPQSVRILDCVEVSGDFHARMDAKQKTYFYDMYEGAVEHPLLWNRATRLKHPCDVALMQQAAKLFEGKHDFRAFRASGSSAKTTVRAVSACNIDRVTLCAEQSGIRLSVTANGFLYKMVRIIAGTLIRVGEKKLGLDAVRELLDAGAEWQHKVAAPAHGLYLFSVMYESNGGIKE